MAQFQVPQFIEKKPKIVGPLTMAQFFYLGGAAAISILAFYTLPGFPAFLVLMIAGGIGVSLAFVKINGMDLPQMILSALKYWQKPKKYIWQREMEMTDLDTSSIEKIKALRRDMSLQERIKSVVKNVMTGNIPLFGKKEGGEKGKKYQQVRYATGETKMAKRVDYSEGE